MNNIILNDARDVRELMDSELDQVSAKNATDIKDLDARTSAGIQKAQSSADAANQAATAAGDQAKKANDTAVAASGHVDTLNTTVGGLDTYKPISDVEVPFRACPTGTVHCA